MSARASRSWTKAGGITPAVYASRSDAKLVELAPRRERGLEPLRLQAAPGPGVAGGRVAVFHRHLAALGPRILARGRLRIQVGRGQAIFVHQRAHLGDRLAARLFLR